MPVFKKCLLILSLFSLSLNAAAKSEYFDAFYGGGIGYTASFVSLPALELPPIPENFDFSGPAYFHGVQGWGIISGNWRLGASVLAGRRILTQELAASDTVVYARFTHVSSMLFAEYVIPLSQRTQAVLNLSAGMTNLSLRYARNPGSVPWDSFFTEQGQARTLTLKNAPALMPSLSWMWQFSQRGGLRLNAGTLLNVLPQTAWKSEDYYPVSNAADGQNIFSVAPVLQAILYFGI